MKRILLPHQRKMLAYTQKVKHPFLFVDMRLGKTLVSVRRINSYGLKNILIVGPYSCIDAWRKELRLEGISWTELFGTGVERKKLIPTLSGWVFTNKEIWRTVPEIQDLNWDVRVLDESTFIKNPNSKISKFFNSERWKNLKHDWRLTGTPNPESDLDFWGQTKRIWSEQNYEHWRGKWFVNFGHEWGLRPATSKKFYRVLARNCFFMSRSDAGLSTRRIYEVRLVRFDDKMKKIYKKLIKTFILSIPEGFEWETQFSGVQYSWLRRLCGGALPDPDGKIRGFWNNKIKELTSLLSTELKKQSVVIWAHFKEEVERIALELKTSFIHGEINPTQRSGILNLFRDRKIQYLVAQPGCLAHSTDLSFCDTMIYYSSPPSAEIRKQSEARLENSSKKIPSLIIDLVTEDTIDEIIAQNHIRKESRALLTKKLVQHIQENL